MIVSLIVVFLIIGIIANGEEIIQGIKNNLFAVITIVLIGFAIIGILGQVYNSIGKKWLIIIIGGSCGLYSVFQGYGILASGKVFAIIVYLIFAIGGLFGLYCLSNHEKVQENFSLETLLVMFGIPIALIIAPLLGNAIIG